MKLVTVEEMRDLERRTAAAGIPTSALMERAGLAVAQVAWESLRSAGPSPRVVVLVGPGNNGGDGLVAARHLQGWGASVVAYLCGQRPQDDEPLHLCHGAGVTVVPATGDPSLRRLRGLLSHARLAIDAVLGTGRSRPVEGTLRQTFACVNTGRLQHSDLRILALDLPSGVDADTGAADPSAMVADVTATLGCPKVGLVQLPGAASAGRLRVVDIGIPTGLLDAIAREVLTTDWARQHLPPRPAGAHKGTFGSVLALVGSADYVGAAYLSCMGAARVGAGYVTLATLPSLKSIIATKLTEATYLSLPEVPEGCFGQAAPAVLREAAQRYDVLLAGCGLGQHPSAEAMVRRAIVGDSPLGTLVVLDADALNLLAGTTGWWERLGAPAILTPHPGEMSRLLGISVQDVEADRLATACRAADAWGATVLLKGAYTVVAAPDGRARVVPFANPALATAGTGDVLAGAVAGLLSQGLPPFDAASLGAFLHAAAGERVAEELGDAGAVAGDLLPALPRTIKAIREGSFTGGPEESTW